MGLFSTVLNEWIILIVAILFVFYKYSVAPFDFFKKKGVPFSRPVPLFGNIFWVVLQRTSYFEFLLNVYEKFKDKKVFGFFEIRCPIAVINDPELIKQVTVKDFDHFVNHYTFISAEDEPLLGNSLFILKDQKWRDMRATLSPAFTGSKMRLMFELIDDVGKGAIEYLKNGGVKNMPIDIEMRDFFTRFTNDVIASAAFGVKIDSLQEKENEFYLMGKKATNFSGLVTLKIFLYSNFKTIMRFLRVRIFEKKFCDYFNHLVLDTIKFREKNGIVRPDMINLLMEARKNALEQETTSEESHPMGTKSCTRNWSDEEVVSNCFLFFLAGFESVSTLMGFCAHELMENPEIQNKLINEIDEVRKSLNGEPITYESVQKMKFLDMVVSETLRKWPPAFAADRVCNQPYTLLDDTAGVHVSFEQGDTLWIPIMGLHHNPEYFPNPKQFDPERFSDDNKISIKPFTYLPFGAGPRNCIGSRLALMECKVIIYHLLSNFTLEASEKTTIPIELSGSGFQLIPKKGFWLRLRPRTNTENLEIHA